MDRIQAFKQTKCFELAVKSRTLSPHKICGDVTTHVIGFYDLVDLWVKTPMILGARSTSRSREQSTKRRSRGKNMRKVCLFYSQNSKIV